MKTILFDIDGTLMRGYGAGSRAMLRAGIKICGDGFGLEGIVMGGGLDPLIYAEAMRKLEALSADALHDAYRDCYLEELALELAQADPRAELLPGVIPLLEALHGRPGVAVGLLTGNYQRAV